MEEGTKEEIKQVQNALLQKHPCWPQDKARWMAMQFLGITHKRMQ